MTKDSKGRDRTVVGGRRGSFRLKEKGLKKRSKKNRRERITMGRANRYINYYACL